MAQRRAGEPLEVVRARAGDAEPARGFVEAVVGASSSGRFGVIAEVKRRSPSAGLIRPEYAREGGEDGFDPVRIARAYSRGGASAISCLTDDKFFGGKLAFLQQIKDAVALPVLRKDFLIDPWQVYEARAAGADAILLIAECLPTALLDEMLGVAGNLGMGTLLEIHDAANLDRALDALARAPGPTLLGINNRDLKAMTTDLGHSVRVAEGLGGRFDRSRLVSESGIRTGADLARLAAADIRAVLIGEHLMRQPDPGAALEALLADAESAG